MVLIFLFFFGCGFEGGNCGVWSILFFNLERKQTVRLVKGRKRKRVKRKWRLWGFWVFEVLFFSFSQKGEEMGNGRVAGRAGF